MSNNNSDQNQDIFTKEQESAIRNAFGKYEERRGIRQDTPEYLQQSFQRKLDQAFSPKPAFYLRWKGLLTALLTAFSLGFMVSRIAFLPAVVTTKGVNDVQDIQSSPDGALLNKSIAVSNPEELVHQIIQTALDAGLEVESLKSNGKYALYIKPFRSKDKEQEAIKALIGLDPEIAGTVNLTISKKK